MYQARENIIVNYIKNSIESLNKRTNSIYKQNESKITFASILTMIVLSKDKNDFEQSYNKFKINHPAGKNASVCADIEKLADLFFIETIDHSNYQKILQTLNIHGDHETKKQIADTSKKILNEQLNLDNQFTSSYKPIEESSSTKNLQQQIEQNCKEIYELEASRKEKKPTLALISGTLDQRRKAWINQCPEEIKNEISKIQKKIKELNSILVPRGREKAKEIEEALNRAINAGLKKKEYTTVEVFKTHKDYIVSFHSPDSHMSIQEALDIKRHPTFDKIREEMKNFLNPSGPKKLEC